MSENLQREVPRFATTHGHYVTQMVKGAGSQVPMPPEEEQKAIERQETGRHAAQCQHYVELDFADERPIPPPPSDMFVVAYTEVGHY